MNTSRKTSAVTLGGGLGTGLGTGPALETLAASFLLGLRAANKSAHTMTLYRTALDQFSVFLRREGMPTAIDAITREHIERWLVELRATGRRPATLRTRWIGLHAFFHWAVDEDEIRVSPMQRLRRPQLDEQPRHVLSDEQLRALLAACEGKGFVERRDSAIVRVLIDTGMRRAELVGMRLADIDWQTGLVLIRGKGERGRYVRLGRKALRAVDSYVRVRARQRHAALPQLWLTVHGALSWSAVQHVLARRARQAGLPAERALHAHLFRHTFAHAWLAAGGQEGDLMQIGGWRSAQVMRDYGALLKTDRALAAHERLSPGDRL
jgi:site-specific recombinase XerD